MKRGAKYLACGFTAGSKLIVIPAEAGIQDGHRFMGPTCLLAGDMKVIREKTIGLIISAIATLTVAGCVSSEQFYESVSLSRDAAYRQWKTRKERQERFQPRISGELSINDC